MRNETQEMGSFWFQIPPQQGSTHPAVRTLGLTDREKTDGLGAKEGAILIEVLVGDLEALAAANATEFRERKCKCAQRGRERERHRFRGRKRETKKQASKPASKTERESERERERKKKAINK